MSDEEFRELIRKFQHGSDELLANEQWKLIEKELFGVEFDD